MEDNFLTPTGTIYIEFKALPGTRSVRNVRVGYLLDKETFHESRDGGAWTEISEDRAELLCINFKLHRHVTVTWQKELKSTILEKSLTVISQKSGWDVCEVPPELQAALNEPEMKL